MRTFSRHQASKAYLFSSTFWHNVLNEKPIDVIMNENKALVLLEREKERLNNKEIMKRLIDIIIILGKTSKSFRGHTEKYNDLNKGMFKKV